VLGHTEGREGNIPIETQIRSLRIPGPHMDSRCASWCPPFVSLRPLLWAALTRLMGFALEPWALANPSDSHGACFWYSCHIPWCRGRVVRGVGCRVSSFLLHLFIAPVEPSLFASSVATPRGYKAGSRSCATYNLPHYLPSSLCLLPYGWKEREIEKQI
jgi:hypothetical protein